MKRATITRSRSSNRYFTSPLYPVFILVVGLIILLFGWHYPFINVLYLYTGLVTLAVGAYWLWYVIQTKRVLVVDKVIRIKAANRFKEVVIPIDENLRWEEHTTKVDFEYTSFLILHHLGGKEILRANQFKNYKELKNAITRNLPRLKPPQGINNTVFSRTVKISIRVLILFWTIALYNRAYNAYADYAVDETVTIQSVLKADPILPDKKDKRHEVALKTVDFDYTFNVPDVFGDNPSTITNLSQGDTVELQILKKDYNAKIAKTKRLVVMLQLPDYNNISVLGIKHNGQTLLSLEQYNQHQSSLLAFLFAVVFISMTTIILLFRSIIL